MSCLKDSRSKMFVDFVSVCLSVCLSICWLATLQAISDPYSQAVAVCICLSAGQTIDSSFPQDKQLFVGQMTLELTKGPKGELSLTFASQVAYWLVCQYVCLSVCLQVQEVCWLHQCMSAKRLHSATQHWSTVEACVLPWPAVRQTNTHPTQGPPRQTSAHQTTLVFVAWVVVAVIVVVVAVVVVVVVVTVVVAAAAAAVVFGLEARELFHSWVELNRCWMKTRWDCVNVNMKSLGLTVRMVWGLGVNGD